MKLELSTLLQRKQMIHSSLDRWGDGGGVSMHILGMREASRQWDVLILTEDTGKGGFFIPLLRPNLYVVKFKIF